jgi:ferritin
MQTISYITFIVLLLSIVQSSTKTLDPVGKCLAGLVTQEFSDSYNYLQLSLKLGATNAYPGFSSFFTKLSDNDASKAHDIVKLLILRKIELHQLINEVVKIRPEITNANNVSQSLKEARNQNEKAWKIVIRCHQAADDIKDANIQDYLESHVLDHHIEIDKLLADFEDRLNNAHVSEKELITFMLDEELLNTYGDGRKDIFS